MGMVGDIITALRWQDILDIGINSYILFRFYVLFRGTTVLRVLFGLAVIWFVQRIALTLGLFVSSWISQGITAAAALIVVVIFRNEIRAVLQSKNIRAILWDLPKKDVTTPIGIIADGVFELAKRRIGALIVIPGRDDLEEIVQHGIPWQGVISKEMIMSIFWPDNPVHDGAVVIRENHILEVGCILPLSKRDDLPSYYGTRHRAGLGLSEKSDAVSIIVSEESGNVMVARKGRIEIVSRKDRLEQRLKAFAGIRLRTSLGQMNERLEMGLATFISIIFVAGIWFSITRGLDILDSFEVPIEYMNRRSDQRIVDTSVNSLKLRLSGTRSLIRSMRPDQLRVTVNLNEAVIGKNTFTITQNDITVPAGIILKDINPENIEVTLDVLSEKALVIQADWAGKLADNLRITKTELSPPETVLIGTKQMLDSLSVVYTQKIQVDEISKSGTIVVDLAFNPARFKIKSGSVSKVKIDYTVAERSKQ
jgi:uncharacterized protein (TIGR00159 family)